jgi:hypothetical protein
MDVLEAYCACTVEVFRVVAITQRPAVVKHLNAIAGKSPQAIANMKDAMTVDTFLRDGGREYQSILDSEKWGPAVDNPDKSGAPKAFMTEVETNALIQQSLAAAKTPKTGKKEGGGTKAERHAWKLVGPKAGEPTTQLRGTYTWYWCAKCEHWRTSHDTDGHTGRPNSGDFTAGTPATTPPGPPAGGAAPTGHLSMIDNSLLGAW